MMKEASTCFKFDKTILDHLFKARFYDIDTINRKKRHTDTHRENRIESNFVRFTCPTMMNCRIGIQ